MAEILWTEADRQMVVHTVDVMRDRTHNEDGYTSEDKETLAKFEQLAAALACGNVVAWPTIRKVVSSD